MFDTNRTSVVFWVFVPHVTDYTAYHQQKSSDFCRQAIYGVATANSSWSFCVVAQAASCFYQLRMLARAIFASPSTGSGMSLQPQQTRLRDRSVPCRSRRQTLNNVTTGLP